MSHYTHTHTITESHTHIGCIVLRICVQLPWNFSRFSTLESERSTAVGGGPVVRDERKETGIRYLALCRVALDEVSTLGQEDMPARGGVADEFRVQPTNPEDTRLADALSRPSTAGGGDSSVAHSAGAHDQGGAASNGEGGGERKARASEGGGAGWEEGDVIGDETEFKPDVTLFCPDTVSTHVARVHCPAPHCVAGSRPDVCHDAHRTLLGHAALLRCAGGVRRVPFLSGAP